jgi:hypothetical protein
MTEQEQQKIAELLKQSLPPVDREPRRDLWPDMLSRLDQHPASRPWFAEIVSPANLAVVPWFDWVLLAVLVLAVCIYPKSIPIWLYHF